MNRLRCALVIAAVMVPSAASAFHPALSFEKTANEGGGGGIYFTGSPRHKGYDCAICHVEPAGLIAAELATDPPELAAGSYQPGATYRITVRLAGEHRGFGTRANQNSFVVEAVGDDALSRGAFVGLDLEEVGVVDDGRVLGGRAGPRTSWRFGWRAPEAGAGAATFHLGVVDGDGAGDPTEARTDPNGDDVAMLALRACEGAPGCAERPRRAADESIAAGCTAGRGDGGLSIVAVLVALLVGGARRRVAGLATVIAVIAGCHDPALPGECAGRICGDVADAGGDGAPACLESWVCTSWEAPPGSDQATRTCTDTNQAGTTACKPSEGPTALPALDLEYYRCNVHPIAQRGCAMMACHGTTTERAYRVYARGRLRNDEIVDRTGSCIPSSGQVNLDEAGTGTVMCEGWLPHTAREWKKSYDSARSFMLGVTDPAQSDLLRQPVVGGKPHVEVKLFRTTDPDYQTIHAWLGGATLGGPCNTGVN